MAFYTRVIVVAQGRLASDAHLVTLHVVVLHLEQNNKIEVGASFSGTGIFIHPPYLISNNDKFELFVVSQDAVTKLD